MVYAATHNTTFFTAWNKYAVDSCQKGSYSPAALIYWATAMTEVITVQLDKTMVGRRDVQNEREENILRQILPTLSDGLALRKVPEMRTACFAIVSILAARIEIGEQALNAMMEAIVKGLTGRPSSAELVCLALLMQSVQFPAIPKPVFKAVTGHQNIDEITSALSRVSLQCDSGNLCLAILTSYKDRVKGKQQDHRLNVCLEFLRSSIDSDLLDAGQLASALKAILTPGDLPSSEQPDTLSKLRNVLFHSGHSKSTRRKIEEALVLSKTDMGQDSTDAVDKVEEHHLQRLENPKQSFRISEQKEWDSLASELPFGSFLSPQDSPLFDILAQHITMDPTVQFTLDDLKSLGVFANQDVQIELAFSTFFLRVLVSRFDSNQKAAALTYFGNFLDQNTGNFDVQLMLPYVLCALVDASPRVRQAATELTLKLNQYYSKLIGQVKNGKEVSVLGKGIVYGTDNKDPEPHWLSVEDAQVLLSDVLVPNLEECDQDHSCITKCLAQIFNNKSPSAEGKHKKRKRSFKTRIFTYFSQIAFLSKSYLLKTRLLTVLNGIDEGKGTSKMQSLGPMLDAARKLKDSELHDACTRDGVDEQQYVAELVAIMTPKSELGLSELQNLISAAGGTLATSLRTAALQWLKSIWPSLGEQTKATFAVCLFQVATKLPPQPSANSLDAGFTLRELKLSPRCLRSILEEVPNLNSEPTLDSSVSKKRKKNDGQAQSSLSNETLEYMWLKITTAIELVDACEAGKDISLFSKMIDMLDGMQQFINHGGLGNSYTQALLLDCLSNIVDNLESSSRQDFEMQNAHTELVVDCFRTAPGPQVRHAALMLLSSIARIAPGVIIHSVMPVFTLMGTTVLTLSNENSIHVVEQTIGSVIPPLLLAFRKQKGGPLAGVSELLTGFVAALEHIPTAQRIGVFSALVDTLGAEEFLFALVILVVDRYQDDRAASDLLVQLATRQGSVVWMKASVTAWQAMD